jgi:hypothetical protein
MPSDEMFAHNLHKKLSIKWKPTVHPCICSWSDLLGFGRMFSQHAWKLTPQQWSDVAKRLTKAYEIQCSHLVPLQEYVLVLNDGVVRTKLLPDSNYSVFYLSIWLREIVRSHLAVNESEKILDYPGTRTTVACGEKMDYSFDEVRVEDVVLNYTKPAGGISNLAQQRGNPVLVSNPSPLQMNTAFSKAYILDSLGSQFGLGGARLFLDESVLGYVRHLISLAPDDYSVVDTEGQFFVGSKVRNTTDPWLLGMQLGDPIAINTPTLTTQVYPIKRFFPHDEDPADFWFDLEVEA